MLERVKKIELPHVFVLLTFVIFVISLFSYIIPSGTYERQEKVIDGTPRTVLIPGTYKHLDKDVSFKSILLGDKTPEKVTPVSVVGFLTAIPQGLQESADIVFFIFIIGGVFGILQKTGTIIAVLEKLMNTFKNSAPLLTFFIMIAVSAGGSTMGMGEEFIPLVPIFIMIAIRLGYDQIYGFCMVLLAAEVGFSSATINPFTVGIANGIAQLPLADDLAFRIVFFCVIFTVMFIYVLRYGAKIKKDPTKSLMYGTDYSNDNNTENIVEMTKRHVAIVITGIIIFAFIIFATIKIHWWFNEMAGGFFLIGIVAVVISGMTLKEAASAFVRGMEDMVVAALVVGFARGIVVAMNDSQILDTIVYSAASFLQNFHHVTAAEGMLAFQSMLNFFIPSGSGQAAVTMPLMAPLADILEISRTTAVFAFTCGDGFSNVIIPTSGMLMAMLSLAKIPYQKWLKFVMPLFLILMMISGIFLGVSVFIHK